MDGWKAPRGRAAAGAGGRDTSWAITIVLSCVVGVFAGAYCAMCIISSQGHAVQLVNEGLSVPRGMRGGPLSTRKDWATTAAAPQQPKCRETPQQPFVDDVSYNDPEEAQAAFDAASVKAYEESVAKYPEVRIEPPHGPVDKIIPPPNRGKVLRGKYHVMNTAGCELRGRWQTLINYYSYKKQKAAYPDGPFGAYTRVLHCAQPDDIMHIVPTIRVDPLPEDILTGYVVLNRPFGLVQWLSRMSIQEEYILMTETDQIFLAPPPLLATPTRPSTFPFFYIDCTWDEYRPHCENPKFNENLIPNKEIQPIGNTPMIISVEMMLEMVPRWDKIARLIHADPKANEELGWVQEMFAIAFAMANTPGGPTNLIIDPCIMSQPPYDPVTLNVKEENRTIACQTDPKAETVDIVVLHYTYATFLDTWGRRVEGDKAAWQFDKRIYTDSAPPLPFSTPPAGTSEGVRLTIEWMNEAGMSRELWPWWKAHTLPA